MIPEQLTSTVWTLSVAVVFSALAGWIPPAAGLFTIAVCWIKIYESPTYTHWRNGRRMRRDAKELAKIRAREKIVIARMAALETARAGRVEAREMVADAKSEAAQLVVHAAADAADAKVT